MHAHPLFKWCCNDEGLPTAAHEPQWGALERRMEPAQPGIRAPTHGVLPQWAGQRGVLLQWTSQARRGQSQHIRTPPKLEGTSGRILLRPALTPWQTSTWQGAILYKNKVSCQFHIKAVPAMNLAWGVTTSSQTTSSLISSWLYVKITFSSFTFDSYLIKPNRTLVYFTPHLFFGDSCLVKLSRTPCIFYPTLILWRFMSRESQAVPLVYFTPHLFFW